MQIPDDKLQEIADLATKMRDLELLIEAREADLTQAKDTLQNLSENLLPDAMAEIGMESFKLKDGTSITISKFYSGSIKPETAEAAFAWLRSTGNDSLIKREVKCMFGKGEDAVANLAVEALKAMNLVPADKASVHPMTLKSFIKEQYESGTDFPAELFGAYVGNKTKIAPPKNK